MSDSILFAGCLLAFFSFAAVLFYFRTGLFGLTALCVFHVTAETLSAFFFGFMLNETPDSFTPEHEQVWTYSVLGLLAMIVGIYFGWRPLKEGGHDSVWGVSVFKMSAHINEDLGWLSFWVGMCAHIALGAVREIPTLSTAVNCVGALARIGVLILLVSAMGTGRWRKFSIAIFLYSFLSIATSLDGGHTFLRIETLLPITVIYIASSGFALKYVVQGALVFVALIPLVSAWLETRNLIRGGFLSGLSTMERVQPFFEEFIHNISFPTGYAFMDMLMFRVDQTVGLAAQVRHQPDVEPFAYGETVYSAFYTLIPRFMWPDKPVVAGGSEFYSRFTGEVRPADDITSIGISYPFELYANAGPILVVIGLGVIGFICARLELKLLNAPKNLGSFWALALVTTVLCDGGQRTDVVLPALVAAGIAAYALGRFVETYVPNWRRLPNSNARTDDTSRSIERFY